MNVDFPITPGAYQTKNPNGQYFPFAAKFSASGQQLDIPGRWWRQL
jgi:hypothetical protein